MFENCIVVAEERDCFDDRKQELAISNYIAQQGVVGDMLIYFPLLVDRI